MIIKLSAEQFREAVTIGLGRAILALSQSPTDADTAHLTHIMLHNTAHDPQLEGPRGWYAVQLVQASQQEASLLETFWNALQDIPPSDSPDEHHRMSVIASLAEAGNPTAIAQMPRRAAANAAAREAAAQRRKRQLPDEVRTEQQRFEREPRTYRAFKSLIEEHPEAMRLGRNTGWAKWASQAPDAEIRQAAQDFSALTGENPDLILSYLFVFIRRPFPLNPDILIEMTQSFMGESPWSEAGLKPEKLIPIRALAALENVQHADVRAFAIEGLRAGKDHLVGLLKHNYQPGDWMLIQDLLQTEYSPETLHDIGRGVIKVFTAHPAEEALPVLQFLVEHGPCSHCRYSLMRGMAQLDALPRLMQIEARLDAHKGTRRWAAQAFSPNL